MAELNGKIADSTPEVEKVESVPADVAESTPAPAAEEPAVEEPAAAPAAEEPKVDEPAAAVIERESLLWDFQACAVVRVQALRFVIRSCCLVCLVCEYTRPMSSAVVLWLTKAFLRQFITNFRKFTGAFCFVN